MRIKNIVIATFWIGTLAVSSAEPIRSTKEYCSPDSIHSKTRCHCLVEHPKQEFCFVKKGPMPSCCIAAEPKSKIHICTCCNQVYGSVRDVIDTDVEGTYEHIRNKN